MSSNLHISKCSQTLISSNMVFHVFKPSYLHALEPTSWPPRPSRDGRCSFFDVYQFLTMQFLNILMMQSSIDVWKIQNTMQMLNITMDPYCHHALYHFTSWSPTIHSLPWNPIIGQFSCLILLVVIYHCPILGSPSLVDLFIAAHNITYHFENSEHQT